MSNIISKTTLVSFSLAAVHTFGRRILYPGATALIQALMGKVFINVKW